MKAKLRSVTNLSVVALVTCLWGSSSNATDLSEIPMNHFLAGTRITLIASPDRLYRGEGETPFGQVRVSEPFDDSYSFTVRSRDYMTECRVVLPASLGEALLENGRVTTYLSQDWELLLGGPENNRVSDSRYDYQSRHTTYIGGQTVGALHCTAYGATPDEAQGRISSYQAIRTLFSRSGMEIRMSLRPVVSVDYTTGSIRFIPLH